MVFNTSIDSDFRNGAQKTPLFMSKITYGMCQ